MLPTDALRDSLAAMTTTTFTEPTASSLPRYDAVTIRLHWATVLLVAAQWLGAELIDFVPDRALHRTYWSIHIVLGLLLAGVLAAHVWWRRSQGKRLPDSNEEGWQTATVIMHAALTWIPVLLVFLGLSIILARGWNLFGVLDIPAVPGGSRPLAHTIKDIHEWTAHMLVFLATGHALAALYHHYAMRDGLLARMGWRM
jgi:cytochrome b561